MSRRFKRAKIKFLSLVKRGANRMPVIYKEDGGFDLDTIVKFADDFEEKGELTAIVYAPELRDSQGDIASAQVIKDMMYDAAQEGLNIDIRHDGTALSKKDAFIAEQFIVQKGDPRFADMKDYNGNTINPTDSWATVIKINSPELKKKYKEEGWNGVSMGGAAEMIQEKSDDNLFRKFMKFVTGKSETNSGEIDMNAEELKKAMEENNKSLISGLAEVLKSEHLGPEGDKAVREKKKKEDEAKKKREAKKEAPEFEGDVSDPEAIKKHEAALAKWSFFKDVDMIDVEQVKAAREKLEAYLEETKKAEEGKTPEKDPEVDRLEKELAQAKKRSNVPVKDAVDKDGNKIEKHGSYEGVGVTKEDADLAAMGAEMAKWCNERSTV